MSEAKFTNGPWSARIDRELYHEVGQSDGSHSFIHCHHNMYVQESTDEAEANAHLIAAAPEMYADIEADIKELSHELTNKELNPISASKLKHKHDCKVKLLAKARGEAK